MSLDSLVQTVRLSSTLRGIKKLHPSCWCNNFAKLCHTVIIFGYRCTWEYPIACLFDSLCKIENWEPAYQICYCFLSSRQQGKMWNCCCNVRPQRGQHCMRMRPRPDAMRLRPEILTSRPRWPRWLNFPADRVAVAHLLLLCTVSRLSVHGWHPLVASEWTRTRHNSCDVAADQAESCHLTWLSLLLFHCLLLLCNMCTSDSFITLSEVYYVCVCLLH